MSTISEANSKKLVLETFQAINEMMVPFKDKHGVKMNMPLKTISWGYKLSCRAVISGYVYGFELVGGMGTSSTPAYIQSTHSFDENKNVVLHLTSELNPKKYKIFFGKLFDSLELLIQLKSMDMYVSGTLSEDVTRTCPLTTGSVMHKEGYGTMS